MSKKFKHNLKITLLIGILGAVGCQLLGLKALFGVMALILSYDLNKLWIE